MGVTSFYVPEPDRLEGSAVRQCFMQGLEGIPWLSKNGFDGRLLSVRRSTNESGQLFIPWPVPGYGRLTLSTTCLREVEAPYCLPIELARGTVGRLRNQVEFWRQQGTQIPEDVQRGVEVATQAMGRAATSSHESATATSTAEAAIAAAVETIDLLMRSYSLGTLTKSGKRNAFFGVNFGCTSGHQFPDDLLGVVNTAVVPFSWNDVEGSAGNDSLEVFNEQIRWSKRLGLRVCGGPLLNLARNQLPDWLYLWEEDADSLQSYMLRYVETIAQRYVGKVNLWHAWAGLNCGQAMSLHEEFRLRVGVAALEKLRQIDNTTPVFVSFDQPWGEYLSRQSLDLAPIHYADTIVRAGLGVAGFGLELNLGYWPGGSLPRDLLEISRLIDRWSSLGLPLVMILTMPSSDHDPGLEDEYEIVPNGADELNQENQARVAAETIKLCLAKPAVQGVIWNQLSDGLRGYPHGGLFTKDHEPKLIVGRLRDIRKNYLI